jgi:multidrug resistance efflux pump
MSDEQGSTASKAATAPELERIRDIIFGPQMRDYQQRFQTIQQDLDRLQQQVDRLREQLTEQDTGQGEKLQALRREAHEADDDLRRELRKAAQELTTSKVDGATLGGLFVEIGTCLKDGSSVADLLQALVERQQSPDSGAS